MVEKNNRMKKFAESENQILIDSYRSYSNGELAELLPGRTEKLVYDQLQRLKIRRTRKEYNMILGRIMTKVPIYPDETKYLLENYYKLTNGQLLEHLNSYRSSSEQLRPTTMLNHCRKLALSRGVQIRWSYSDTRRLKKWHPFMGDKQIAEHLNRVGCSRRRINEKMVYKVFTRKHIEKKRELLGIKRTPAQLALLRKDNIMCGEYTFWSGDNNPWNNGSRPGLKEEEVIVRNDQNGVQRRYIKVGDRITPYRRWFYQNFIGPVPGDMVVHGIDLDPMNDDPGNLVLRKKTIWTREMITEGLALLRKKRATALGRSRRMGKKPSWLVPHRREVVRLSKLIDRYEDRIRKRIPREAEETYKSTNPIF